MTKSPLAVTLVPLLPLAALAWPLARVLNQKAYQPDPEPPETSVGALATADLSVQSAHPFESLSVTIGKTTWDFSADEDIKEISYPVGPGVDLTVTVAWPPGTPETATLVTLEPLKPVSRPGRSHTFWGYAEVTEPITFSWEDGE